MFAAGAFAAEESAGRYPHADRQTGQGTEGRWPDEHAVRRAGRQGLSAGSQSTRFAHQSVRVEGDRPTAREDRGAVRSEEHTSELQSLMRISYAVFCLKK